jgi:hypothetical protein
MPASGSGLVVALELISVGISKEMGHLYPSKALQFNTIIGESAHILIISAIVMPIARG